MLGTGSFEPVLAGGTVVCRRESDRLLEIRTEISFAMTIHAIWRMTDGVYAIRAVTVDFSDLACHLVVPAAILGALGFEITHVDDGEKGREDKNELPIPDRRLVGRLSQGRYERDTRVKAESGEIGRAHV